MKDYQFKVGDKGKTRDGKRKYEVIALVSAAEKGLAIIIEGAEGEVPFISSRYPNGALLRNGSSEWDLLPPTRTVYVNFYKAGEAYYYDSEWRAQGAGAKTAIAVAVPVEIPG